MRQSRENKAQSSKRDSALKAECYNKAAGFVHKMTKRARWRERVKRDGDPQEEKKKTGNKQWSSRRRAWNEINETPPHSKRRGG